MKISIEFSTDNAAFDEPTREIIYILQDIGSCLMTEGMTEGPCVDHNGNTVGRWSWN